ncbi:hypothetical protein BpHYR1_047178 [Brachionus plicatilis]|uniref:Uncharacterized protein n=1 Tax=Brachionus plicatilis TaxID=10195 RepID=A0A3M7S1T5_BRAPC|nr:hypothetical protein BpHYR1_047178 [Brachionus plicatilis]
MSDISALGVISTESQAETDEGDNDVLEETKLPITRYEALEMAIIPSSAKTLQFSVKCTPSKNS